MKNENMPPIVYQYGIVMNEIEKEDRLERGLCPQCEKQLIFENGCKHCNWCGWDACEN